MDIYIFFDNSMTHCKRAPDGLDAGRLNLNDGGKERSIKMRNGWYNRISADGEEERVVQSMYHPCGKQRGLTSILAERNLHLNENGHPLCKVCHSCLNKTPHEERENRTLKCCAWYVLSQQPDFLEQRPWLQEVVEDLGFNIMFYPKYHCELNWIEMIWGWAKTYHRKTCSYNFNDLDGEEGLRATLDRRIPLAFIRRAAQHCLRYMHYYRMGLVGTELEFAVKKFKAHRTISPSQREMIRLAFKKHSERKSEQKIKFY